MAQKNYNEYFNEGISLLKAGNLYKSLNIFKKLNKEFPKEIIFLNYLGEICLKNKSTIEAIKWLEKSIRINPKQDNILLNLGLAFFQLNQNEHALNYLTKAKSINNQNIQIFLNLGIILTKLNKFEQAITELNEGLLIDENNFSLLFNIGIAYQKINKLEEALSYFLKCEEIQSENYEICISLSNIYSDSNNYSKALELCSKALKINETADAYCNRGILHHYLGEYKNAIKDYDKSIQLDNNYKRAFFNKSITLLKLKEFSLGWDLYKYRWQTPAYENIVNTFPKNKKKWDGSKDETLLLLCEQGLGDQILFCSFLNEVKLHCRKLIVKLDKRLLNLFRRSFNDIDFISKDSKNSNLIFDSYLPLGDLCKFFRKTESDFKPQTFFLTPDNTISEKIQNNSINKVLYKNKINCGLSWRSINTNYDKEKSIDLEMILKELDVEKYNFINLQYGDVKDEINYVEKKYGIKIIQENSIDNFNDIDGLCSLISLCDIVISTSNVTVHLASSIGKDVRLILNKNSPWWWFNDQNKSLWYKCCQIYNNQTLNKTFKQLNDDLKKLEIIND